MVHRHAGLRRATVVIPLLVASLFHASQAWSTDIITEWASARTPPVPELHPVVVEGRTTALLILDLGQSCEQRPRCIASIPRIKRLYDAAKAAGAMLFFTADPHRSFPESGMIPRDGEWVSQSGPDKFIGTNLAERLKFRGIQTVIVTGTSAQGVVLGTSSGSAQRGYRVVVPVDTMSSEDLYMEQYAAWHLYKGGPGVVTHATTLTRSDMIRFSPQPSDPAEVGISTSLSPARGRHEE